MNRPTSNYKLARSLGWTSLAVGLTELAATRWVQKQIGVSGKSCGLIRSFGVREIANGAAILREPGVTNRLSGALWARVAGDVIDLAALAKVVPATRNSRGLAAIIATVLAVTGLDVLTAALVQNDLLHARAASAKAKLRVMRTSAQPHGAPAENPASPEKEATPAVSI